ncbi:MAG: hypothetical protein [Bacteriophage sp.]|nr:MAG: hypothetical protein [Bacteriophage sp.]
MDQYPQSTRETVTMILEKEYDADDNVIYRITKILPATSFRIQLNPEVSISFPAFYDRSAIAMKLIEARQLIREQTLWLEYECHSEQ